MTLYSSVSKIIQFNYLVFHVLIIQGAANSDISKCTSNTFLAKVVQYDNVALNCEKASLNCTKLHVETWFRTHMIYPNHKYGMQINKFCDR